MKFETCKKESFVVIGKEGSTKDGADFIPKLWEVANAKFNEVAPIDGIILTKLDGTAKGGIAIAIQAELGIPVKYIGVGEKIEDLQKFNPDAFVRALFERGEDNDDDVR